MPTHSPSPDTHTVSECRTALRRVADYLGGVPSKREYAQERNANEPEVDDILYYFDDWDNVQYGLSLLNTPSVEERYLTHLEDVAESLNKTPTVREYDAHRPDDAPPAADISELFDGWVNAREQADLPPPETDSHYSDDECYSALRKVAEQLGRSPTMETYNDEKPESAPSAQTIARRAGGWRDAHEEADATLKGYGKLVNPAPTSVDVEEPRE